MSENIATAEEAVADNSAFFALFGETLAPIQPDFVRDMIAEKLIETFDVVQLNNANVARVGAAKKADPNNMEFLDAEIERVSSEGIDPKLTAKEKRYQKLRNDAEILLKEMRDMVKEHIQPPLSEEELQKTRKAINEAKPLISDSMISAKNMAAMADKALAAVGAEIPDGGVISLMPQAKSLLNTRTGGKSRKGLPGEKPYSTRLLSAFVNGAEVIREKKNRDGEIERLNAHFNAVAEDLSKLFNADKFEGNAVTPREVEEAYYDANGKEFRDNAEMPTEFEFRFTKEIEVQNPNDDSTKRIPENVSVKIIQWTKEGADALAGNVSDEKPEGETSDANAPADANATA